MASDSSPRDLCGTDSGGRSARAAKKSAAAALLNAQAVINAERARLAVDLELAPLFGNVLFGQGEMVAHFTVKCTNIGKTSAWVYRILADFRSVEIIRSEEHTSELQSLRH